MNSFTLNTTSAYHFCIFEKNGPVSCSSEIQELLLRPRQQGSPYSIDMIERYQLTLWKVRTVKISTTTAMAMAIIIQSIKKMETSGSTECSV